jgi:pimeloyl-ACP methyl ester carboxylesterase
MCCASETLDISTMRSWWRRSKTIRAHHGMITAARALKNHTERILLDEIANHSGYSLVIAGHSMGGGAAALLGLLWQEKFRDLAVYAYGPPCLITHEDWKVTRACNIVSIVVQDDPFSCLSLGHIADITVAISHLCDDSNLRELVWKLTTRRVEDMDENTLRWCYDKMEKLQSEMSSEQLVPPGRLLVMDDPSRDGTNVAIREVSPSHFDSLIIRPGMFDLTRHAPHNYILNLRKLLNKTLSGV